MVNVVSVVVVVVVETIQENWCDLEFPCGPPTNAAPINITDEMGREGKILEEKRREEKRLEEKKLTTGVVWSVSLPFLRNRLWCGLGRVDEKRVTVSRR